MIHDLFAKKTERPAYYTMFANLKQNCHYITNALKSEPDNLAAGTARSESDFFNTVPNLVHKSSFIPSADSTYLCILEFVLQPYIIVNLCWGPTEILTITSGNWLT